MCYWRVFVKSGDGRKFFSTAMNVSTHRMVLRGDHVLPTGMVCDLQIIIPPLNENQHAGVAVLQAEVDEVVFSSGDVQLHLKVKSLSNDARRLISA